MRRRRSPQATIRDGHRSPYARPTTGTLRPLVYPPLVAAPHGHYAAFPRRMRRSVMYGPNQLCTCWQRQLCTCWQRRISQAMYGGGYHRGSAQCQCTEADITEARRSVNVRRRISQAGLGPGSVETLTRHMLIRLLVRAGSWCGPALGAGRLLVRVLVPVDARYRRRRREASKPHRRGPAS